MDQRIQLIREHQEGESISALAEIYGVSRKTVYKWLVRHAALGVAGLADRSREPQHCPSRLSEETIAEIIAARHRWNWGPRREFRVPSSRPRNPASCGPPRVPSARC